MAEPIFREKSLKRITSPEELGDYLRVTSPTVWMVLAAVIPAFEALEPWDDEHILDTMVKLAEARGEKNAKVMWPVRIAAAGKAVTPGGAVEICRILGKDETLRRLRVGLEKLG